MFILVLANACSRMSENTGIPGPSDRTLADSLRIDSLLHQPALRFQRALDMETSDTSQAREIYTQIAGDSHSYWGAQAQSRLRFLNGTATKADFIRKISGTWDWSWKGTNWGDIEKTKKGVLERQLVIKENGEIEFHENNRLVRADRYEIRNSNDMLSDRYQLVLKKSQLIYRLTYLKTHLILSEPDCVCGCVTNEYFRKWKRDI